jgi:hypothetical protein
MGAPGEALAQQLEALDAMRYARDGLARPSPVWWRAFERSATSLAAKAHTASR